MNMPKDLSNQNFGALHVLEIAEKDPTSGKRRWRCRCECGEYCTVLECRLLNGTKTSCGCGIHRMQKQQEFYKTQEAVNSILNRKVYKNSSSGVNGVARKSGGKWCAYITHNHKRYYLGTFKKKSQAIRARKNAENDLLRHGSLE